MVFITNFALVKLICKKLGMKKAKTAILLIGPTIIGILSVLPQANTKSSVINEAIQVLNQNAPWIALIISILILLLQLSELLPPKENEVIKAWTKRFLRFIAKEQLGGGEYNTRVSVLRPQKGYRFIFDYLWIIFVKNFIANWKNHTWIMSIRNIPKPFADYLTLYARYSYPNEETSYTHFKISKKGEGFNGVADKCYKEGREIEVITCDISNVHLPSNFKDINASRTTISRNVKKYMKDTFIDESNYYSLINMNTRANNLYALAITKENEEIWGVLIIDNVGETPRSFKSEMQSVIDKYAKIFCFTLSTVK